jgi:hypothetical protein
MAGSFGHWGLPGHHDADQGLTIVRVPIPVHSGHPGAAPSERCAQALVVSAKPDRLLRVSTLLVGANCHLLVQAQHAAADQHSFRIEDETDEDEEPQDGSRADDSQWFARK